MVVMASGVQAFSIVHRDVMMSLILSLKHINFSIVHRDVMQSYEEKVGGNLGRKSDGKSYRDSLSTSVQ